MSREPLYKLPVKQLSDLASSRALERVLIDAAASHGQAVDDLDAITLEQILKNEVYKRLQQTVPAPLAKKRVMEVLKELERVSAGSASAQALAASPIPAIEESSKRFTLYFDWPEAQRLRGVLSLARTEEEAGRPIAALVQEGRDLLSQMERKLEEGLVAQAQDLAELKATLTRVQGMGGRDVRRLESLVGQIDEAQGQATLIPGEVERARNISFKLRKNLESSMVQGIEGAQGAPESQARVQALEQEHAARQLADLSRDFAGLLRARPELHLQNDELRLRQSAGILAVEAVDAWRLTLEQTRLETVAQQREELADLEVKLTDLPEGASAHDIRVGLDVARHALESGNLATDELRELRVSASALTHSPVEANRILDQQRELAELERSAREVPGAEEELRAALHSARDTLANGHELDLAPLWAILEQRMGQAALQREDFDARADHVVREYDKVRSLAGETTQRLGRLADTLRAQRRLGPMSASARERYAQTLTDAEALLTEARAEYQAAQEVTSTFGQDALSDLLDVFDVGGDSENPFAGPAPAAPKASVFDSLLSAPPTAPAPSAGKETDWGQFNAGHVEKWTVHDGQILSGNPEQSLIEMAAMLGQADRMGLQRLDMGDGLHVWSARLASPGQWRLARGRNWDALDASAGRWLDTGME